MQNFHDAIARGMCQGGHHLQSLLPNKYDWLCPVLPPRPGKTRVIMTMGRGLVAFWVDIDVVRVVSASLISNAGCWRDGRYSTGWCATYVTRAANQSPERSSSLASMHLEAICLPLNMLQTSRCPSGPRHGSPLKAQPRVQTRCIVSPLNASAKLLNRGKEHHSLSCARSKGSPLLPLVILPNRVDRTI